MPRYNRVCSVAFASAGTTFLNVEGLRVTFSVDKSPYAEPNTCQVSVYNLTETTRNRIKTAEKLYLRAGYEDESDLDRLVCAMDIAATQTTAEPPDTVTTIVGADGMGALRESKGAVSFKGGVKVSDIVAKLGSMFGLVVRDLGSAGDATYRNGFAEMGPVGDLFDRLAAKIGAVWSFQNGEVQFTPARGANSARLVVLNSQSGLVGSPKPTRKVGDPSAPAETEGWSVRSLILPIVEPGGKIRLESAVVTGDFRIDKVVHTGDTHGQEWYTDLEVSTL